jgi:hypothetical protein
MLRERLADEDFAAFCTPRRSGRRRNSGRTGGTAEKQRADGWDGDERAAEPVALGRVIARRIGLALGRFRIAG